MYFVKNNSKITKQAILFAFVVFFLSAFVAFGLNNFPFTYCPPPVSVYSYYYTMGEEHWNSTGYPYSPVYVYCEDEDKIYSPYAWNETDYIIDPDKWELKGYEVFEVKYNGDRGNKITDLSQSPFNQPIGTTYLPLNCILPAPESERGRVKNYELVAIWIERSYNEDAESWSGNNYGSIDVTFSDENYDGSKYYLVSIFGWNEDQFDGYDNRLDFYSDTLKWDISQYGPKESEEDSANTTWYLPRRNKDKNGKFYDYNNGLPVLRQFVDWQTVRYYLRYTACDGRKTEVKIFEFQIPRIDSTLNNALMTNYVSRDEYGDYFEMYGYRFYATIDYFIKESGRLVESDEAKKFINSNVTFSKSGSLESSIITIFADFQENSDWNKDGNGGVFEKLNITFNAPLNRTTGLNKNVFWRQEIDDYTVNLINNGSAVGKTYTVYKNVTFSFDSAQISFTFNALINKQEKDVVVTLVVGEGYDYIQGGIKGVWESPPEDETSFTQDISSSKSGPALYTGEISIDYELVYYVLSAGYTMQPSSWNTQLESGLRDNYYFGKKYPEQEYDPMNPVLGGPTYQDVKIYHIGGKYALSVEGYELPYDEANLRSIFQNDYRYLTENNGTVFNCWLIDKQALKKQSYEEAEGEPVANGDGTYTQRWYKDGGWLEFTYTDEITTMDGKRTFYNHVTTISGYSNADFRANTWGDNNYGYDKDSLVMPLIPSWNKGFLFRVYNKKESVTDSEGQTRNVTGVIDKSLQLTDYTSFRIFTSSNVEFILPSGTAFLSYDEAKTSSSLYDANGKYGLFKYGYNLVAYTISFKYGGTTYYVYINEDGNWDKIASTEKLISVETLDENNNTGISNFASLAGALSSWTQGDFIFADSSFAVRPVWEAASIELKDADNPDNPPLANTTYNADYKISRGDLASVGKSIAFFNTNNGNVVVCDDGNLNEVKWNYLDISSSDYEYDQNGNKYVVTLTKYEVDNIYKVKLLGLTGASLSTCDYVQAEESSIDKDLLTDAVWGEYFSYASWVDAGYDIDLTVEVYANEFQWDIESYLTGINNNSTDYFLRQLFVDSSNQQYIFLANNRTIGNLMFDKQYFDPIAWKYSGVNGKVAFKTPKFDEALTQHKNKLNGLTSYAGISENWKVDIDADNSNTSATPTLYAIYYRESYYISLDVLKNQGGQKYKDFVGYLKISVVDNAVAGVESVTGTYLAKFDQSQNLTKIYAIGGNDVTRLSQITLPTSSMSYILICRGCSVTIEVFDQSQVKDMSINNTYYDSMIGYRYSGNIDCSINNIQQTTKATGYSYNIPFNTNTEIDNKTRLNGLLEEPVLLDAGCTINIAVLFEPINYNISLEMTNKSAGQMEIKREGYQKQTTSAKYTISNLQRGDKCEMFYYAYAGYALAEKDFTINDEHILSLDMNGAEITRSTAKEKQTYYLNLSGAWLRKYFYKNGTNGSYSVDTLQEMGNINVNIVLLEFDIYYRVYEQDNSIPLQETKQQSGWTLDDSNHTLDLPYSTYKDNDNNPVYCYTYDNKPYAFLSSWGYRPKAISNRTLYYCEYEFLLKTLPVNTYRITTDNLFNLVVTDRGIIVPATQRKIYFAIEVTEMFKITLAVVPSVNDTNCSTRVVQISNGTNNALTFTAESGHVGTLTSFIYTHKGLQNSISASYNDKYYTGVTFQDENTTVITSPFTTDKDITVYANFTPVELPIELLFTYMGQPIENSAISTYFTDWLLTVENGSLNNIKNNPQTGNVVTNDIISISYNLKETYNLTITVNEDASRLDGENKIYVTNSDYEQGVIFIFVQIVDKKQGQIYLKIVGDSSNGAVFHSADNTTMNNFADIWIKNTNSAKEGAFIQGYSVVIKINSIPTGYRYVGVKKDYGNIDNVKYQKQADGTILITDGTNSQGLSEDGFVASVAGTYYVVFQKVLIDTELVLVPRNLNNYTYQSNGITAENTAGKLKLTKMSSVNDTLTLVRKQNLPNEQLVYYSYMDSQGEHRIYGNSLIITNEIIERLDGDLTDGAKLLKIYVNSILKYNVTVNVDQSSAQYIKAIKVNDVTLSGNTKFESAYYVENSSATLNITSILPTKYTIVSTGDISATGAEIDKEFYLSSNKTINVSITKNDYALNVTEQLFDDIVKLNMNTPSVLTGEDIINNGIDGKTFVYDEQTNVVFKQAQGEGENKKQLTSIKFTDNESLTFTFNMNMQAQDLNSCFDVQDIDGNRISTFVASLDDENANQINLTVTVNGQTFNFTLSLNVTGDVTLGFVGKASSSLTLTYTIYKLITVS